MRVPRGWASKQAIGTRAILAQAMKFGFNSSVSVPLESTPCLYPRALDEPQTMLSDFGDAGQGPLGGTPIRVAATASGQTFVVDAGGANLPGLVQPG